MVLGLHCATNAETDLSETYSAKLVLIAMHSGYSEQVTWYNTLLAFDTGKLFSCLDLLWKVLSFFGHVLGERKKKAEKPITPLIHFTRTISVQILYLNIKFQSLPNCFCQLFKPKHFFPLDLPLLGYIYQVLLYAVIPRILLSKETSLKYYERGCSMYKMLYCDQNLSLSVSPSFIVLFTAHDLQKLISYSNIPSIILIYLTTLLY